MMRASATYRRILKTAIDLFPSARPLLSNRARWIIALSSPIAEEVKTQTYFRQAIERLVRKLYSGVIGGEFVDEMAKLIQSQLTQAYKYALRDEGVKMDDQFAHHMESLIFSQFEFVDQYFHDIINAFVEDEPIEPLMARAALWANRYSETYNEALREIARRFGKKMIWTLGKTETHCETCEALNGIVAFHSDWERFGFRPQSAPNAMLDCGGWRCDCSLTPTNNRRTRDSAKALAAIAAQRR